MLNELAPQIERVRTISANYAQVRCIAQTTGRINNIHGGPNAQVYATDCNVRNKCTKTSGVLIPNGYTEYQPPAQNVN